ncbi:helix-turn-helix domain-containing protein [Paludibaculum fermentans]|uniref:helix-turn-helix domain-containing protein n=1 Tax=Paludibaculum fermentans TaxID=1473598 RepID=UPI003EBA5BDF
MATTGGQQGGKPLLLREHRIKHKVRLEDIAEATKISRRFLEAIEMGEYGKLPGGVFTTSYIRQYAAAIGFEADEILADCQASLGEKQPERREPGSEAAAGATKWYRFLSLG